MTPTTLPWETWRAVITVLREKGLPSMLDHADYLERRFERSQASRSSPSSA